MSILDMFTGFVKHDSLGEIAVPLAFEVADDDEADRIQVGEAVVFNDEVGRIYRGVLIDKYETAEGARWGLVHYRYQWGEVIHIGYSWQSSDNIVAAADWDWQFVGVAS